MLAQWPHSPTLTARVLFPSTSAATWWLSRQDNRYCHVQPWQLAVHYHPLRAHADVGAGVLCADAYAAAGAAGLYTAHPSFGCVHLNAGNAGNDCVDDHESVVHVWWMVGHVAHGRYM
jgi:hypothetical protein